MPCPVFSGRCRPTSSGGLKPLSRLGLHNQQAYAAAAFALSTPRARIDALADRRLHLVKTAFRTRFFGSPSGFAEANELNIFGTAKKPKDYSTSTDIAETLPCHVSSKFYHSSIRRLNFLSNFHGRHALLYIDVWMCVLQRGHYDCYKVAYHQCNR